jgi:hypothetical protein
MEKLSDIAVDDRASERLVVTLISGLLTLLMVAPVAYVLLKAGGFGSHSDPPLLTRSVIWGMQSGCVVSAEFYLHTRMRPQTTHRFVDAAVAGLLAAFVTWCCFSLTQASFAEGDFGDRLRNLFMHHLEERAIRTRLEEVTFFYSSIVCGLQAAGHVFAWHAKSKKPPSPA